MTEVIFSSSYDEKKPTRKCIWSIKKIFFASTGMFTQEIWIQFGQVKIVNGVNLTGYGIKKIVVNTCENDSAHFTIQSEQSKVPNSNGLQIIKLKLKKNPKTRVLKIELLEGYEDFFTFRNVGAL